MQSSSLGTPYCLKSGPAPHDVLAQEWMSAPGLTSRKGATSRLATNKMASTRCSGKGGQYGAGFSPAAQLQTQHIIQSPRLDRRPTGRLERRRPRAERAINRLPTLRKKLSFA